MPDSWNADYLNGRTAARQRITITVASDALHLFLSGGQTKEWPYDRIRQTQGAYSGEEVRLECGGEAIIVPTTALLTAIHLTAPAMGQRFHNPSSRKARVHWTLCAAFGILLMVAGLYRWGIPGMAAVVTPYVPLSWEDRIGRQVVEHLAPEARQCHDPDRLRKLEQVVQALTTTRSASPYHIRLSVVNAPSINAFAAPGGHVVILRGLLEKTDSPEEFAGVMAHELQHVYQRHTTQAILEQAASTLLLTAISGDLSGSVAWGLEGARMMGSLHYSRAHETEADIKGLRMLQAANLDPAAMITIYGNMHNGAEGTSGPPDFLSTHPDMVQRLDTLINLAGPPPAHVITLLPGEDWKDIRSLCRLKADARPALVAADGL
jgi:Zn-dependent protease with chaperone function